MTVELEEELEVELTVMGSHRLLLTTEEEDQVECRVVVSLRVQLVVKIVRLDWPPNGSNPCSNNALN